jgi:exopolysaccharide biosynthesis polyprenyl glycosylphosphotransferase
VEVLLSLLAGGVVVVAAGAHAVTVGTVFGLWALGNFYKGAATTSPIPQRLRVVGRSVLPPLAASALAVAFAGVPSEALVPVTLAVVCGAGVSAGFGALRWRLQSPIRVLVVGDRTAIERAVSRWQSQRRVNPVAAILVEPDPADVPRHILGVPTVTGLEATPAVAQQVSADLVAVASGPGFRSRDLRWLAWNLEETKAALGMLGVLDAVSPHRVTPGFLQGEMVTDVRLPRPPRVVQHAKVVFDRVGGVLLLVLAAPLLLAIAVAVRLDTPGGAFYTQTRVGYHGRHFKLYKLRSMVDNAEELQGQLVAGNEYDDVLFKLRRDPRVTRVGAVLRRFSLDELPQLVNVVRGEMSLVGPRPSLPSEVEVMDTDTLRRLAVRPGITGLWQVSGRSDLAWEDAAALDTYYADNWSLGGDLRILLRTVKAVVGGRGAY